MTAQPMRTRSIGPVTTRRAFLSGTMATMAFITTFALSGCGDGAASGGSDSTAQGEGATISVYTRENGSGTRSAFIELFGIEEKDASGNKVDMTTTAATVTNSTAVMMTLVSDDQNAIGYISLGSLDDSVKALQVDGVAATPENVKSGDYKIFRPFNIVKKDQLSKAADDFLSFIMSTEGQQIVGDNNYIAVDGGTPYSAAVSEGKVIVAGSSSVTPVMEKLAEAYREVNPGIRVEVQQSDSTTGVNMTIDGTCDLGMVSRELEDSEISAGLTSLAIALDGIAVIVSPQSELDAISSDDIRSIYIGEITSWGQID